MIRIIRHLSCFLIAAVLIGNTLAYGDETTPPADADRATPKTPSAHINVIFEVSPRQENSKLYFDIEANLPDGMVFMSAIRDKMGIVHKTSTTLARIQTEITGGRILLGPFPLGERPFPPGEYTIYIYSYPDEFQPEHVIEIIGKNGTNLTGQDVVGGMILFGKDFMITG